MKSQAGLTAALLLLTPSACLAQVGTSTTTSFSHVLLISIDGMHAIDFTNCAKGLASVNNGAPYCPNLAQLAQNGVTYVQALTPRPSDSFPGLTALVTGGTPRSAGLYYDVSYDRALSPPAVTTPYGIKGGSDLCPKFVGTQVGFDEEIDVDYTKLDGGGGINPNYLPRDPNNNCAPVFPHSFIRVNTIFEVAKANGLSTAWSDKHPSYDLVNGPSGKGVDDLYSPEINSVPVALPSVTGCSPLPDPGTATSSNAWTDSFQNIQCYDSLKVNAVLNWAQGLRHDGSAFGSVPAIFGMNFQAVSVGQKLNEKSLSMIGGYLDSAGTPTAALLGEITYVDTSIGSMVSQLKNKGLFNSTLIIITAKHGQSPIDPNRIHRIPADASKEMSPSDVLGGVGSGLTGGGLVGQALEDDASIIWLTDPTQVAASVTKLEQTEATIGGGQIYSGATLDFIFPDASTDSRSPNIVLAPNVGVTYTGGTKKIAEHGGFANDDRNVMLLVAGVGFTPKTVMQQVETRQVAPTIMKALGLDPTGLKAVVQESTQELPGLPF